MYHGLVHLHSFIRWVIIILLLVAFVRHISGYLNKKPFTNADKKIDLFLMISAHTQLLIGLYLWFVGPFGYKLLQSVGFGAAMKEPSARFWIMEHNVGMLIGIILITIGRGVVKKNIPDATKHKRAFLYFLFALIIILASVPWPFREAIARPLFPGM